VINSSQNERTTGFYPKNVLVCRLKTLLRNRILKLKIDIIMTQVRFNHRPFDVSFNNLLDGFFATQNVSNRNNGHQNWKGVPVNIRELDNSYGIEVIAPGFDKADFKVNVEQDVLTISAEKKQEVKAEATEGTTPAPAQKEKEIRTEYNFRSFKRSFTLDEKIDAGAIEAKYVNGVLTLNLPKKVEVKSPAKEISIQ
jgi:HSP20 family protein